MSATEEGRAYGIRDQSLAAKVWRRAVKLHERDCPGDDPLSTCSENHKHVHEQAALVELRHEKSAS